MADYRPDTAFQAALERCADLPGALGRSAYRKLRRRYKARAMRAFDAVLATLKPGDICLDLGANLGTVSARMAATGATVHAYEPDPATFARLVANTAHLANVVPHAQAVGATSGTVQLRRVRDDGRTDADYRTLGSSVVFDDPRMESDGALSVEQVAFGDLLRAHGPHIRLIKMDIEGAELPILRDLMTAGSPAGFDALYVETHEVMYPAHRPEVQRLRDWAAGFAVPDINLYWV
jgi:FkbM family methyltransferase